MFSPPPQNPTKNKCIKQIHALALDLDKAISYFQKACDNNESTSCGILGELYIAKDVPKINYDPEKARKYFEKSCKLNNKNGCNRIKNLKSRKIMEILFGL